MKRIRRPKRWLAIYLLLLVASLLSQWLAWGGWPEVGEPASSAVVQVDGEAIRLAYTTYESPTAGGETLIAIHGSPTMGRDFAHLGPMLAERVRVVAVDLPGYDGSSKWVGDYSMRANARYVLALMDELGIEHAHVLGFSYGSGVALYLADDAPRRVDSLILFGGIGVQEGEGSGDYYFEHLKYALGYAAFVVGPEFVPHFGLLGRRDWRHAWIRNFWDSDQRPLRGIIEKLTMPVLILHGRDDPLVPARVAYQHHDLIAYSELVMFDDSHFMLFSAAGSRKLADQIKPFLERAGRPPQRRTTDYANRPLTEPTLPGGVNLRREMGPWATMGAIILGTFVLEDPTSVGVGLLIKEGHVDLFVGLIAIFVGIFVGDLGLYAIGWLVGRPALRWRPVAKRLPVHRVEALGRWFDRHGFSAVLASRFIPGSRFPLYVSAGALGLRPRRFAMWTCAAVGMWVVVILLIVVVLGEAAVSPFELLFGRGWLSIVAAIVLLLVLLHNVPFVFTRMGRARLAARWSRLWRWEFWPVWAFVGPMTPAIVFLARRHKGLGTLTAVNPAIPHGGFVGESKYQILRLLPEAWCVAYAMIDPGPAEVRMGALEASGLDYPMVLKPDAGQRGAGVKLVSSEAAAAAYLQLQTAPVLAQAYHEGPFEAGIFYVRRPDEARGRIYSITDKRFSYIEGDGKRTLEQLVWGHRRYRMQAELFLSRHEEHRDRVLAAGERWRLALAGNHCQGTEFRDGSHLLTPGLEAAIDRIAQHTPGVYLGRFDVRYADVDELKAGRGFAILEFNGVTGESTNLYDPDFSLAHAYRIWLGQWKAAFEIGHANREAGVHAYTTRQLWRMIRDDRKLRVGGIATD